MASDSRVKKIQNCLLQTIDKLQSCVKKVKTYLGA